MKKILFNSLSTKIHTLWQDLLDNPPENYNFILNHSKLDINKLSSFKKNKFINILYKKIFSKFITPISLSSKFVATPKEIDLIYCPDSYTNEMFPFICDSEEAIVFAGHSGELLDKNKEKIKSALSSKYCKKILAFTTFAKKSLEEEFKSKEINDKTEVVHFGVNIKKIKSKRKSKDIEIIFVGTANQTDPMIFNLKGGREAIETFKIISKKYDNVRLKIISNIPKDIDTDIKGLEIFPLMDREKLFDLYSQSDIFLFPTYMSLGMTIVEAMGSGLAMICTDMFGVPDSIEENKNGFLVKIKNKGKYEYRGPSISDFGNFMNFIYENNKEEIINQTVNYLSQLIENPRLIEKMGKESRKKYEKEFSTEVRNKKLKKIFDEVLEQ